MKTIARSLITTIIIFSIALVAGERKTRINLVIQSASEFFSPMSEDAGGYPIIRSGNSAMKAGNLKKIASRKKTAARSV